MDNMKVGLQAMLIVLTVLTGGALMQLDAALAANPPKSIGVVPFEAVARVPKMKPKPGTGAEPVTTGKERFILKPVKKNVFAYDFTVWAANYCYSRGKIYLKKELPAAGGRPATLEIVAEIDHEPGYCAQAAQKISFEGEMTTNLSGKVHVVVHVVDNRSGRQTSHDLKLNI